MRTSTSFFEPAISSVRGKVLLRVTDEPQEFASCHTPSGNSLSLQGFEGRVGAVVRSPGPEEHNVESPVVPCGETEDAARFEAGRKTPNSGRGERIVPARAAVASGLRGTSNRGATGAGNLARAAVASGLFRPERPWRADCEGRAIEEPRERETRHEQSRSHWSGKPGPSGCGERIAQARAAVASGNPARAIEEPLERETQHEQSRSH